MKMSRLIQHIVDEFKVRLDVRPQVSIWHTGASLEANQARLREPFRSKPDNVHHRTDLTVTMTSMPLIFMGWLMGIEPTTTGITIRDSTTELQPPS